MPSLWRAWEDGPAGTVVGTPTKEKLSLNAVLIILRDLKTNYVIRNYGELILLDA